jgi:predicted MPP superfamily phosphohydrolase
VPLILRLLISASISGAIHCYVYSRLVTRTAMPPKWQRGLAIAMAVLWAAIPLTTALRNYDATIATTMSWVSMPWMSLIGLSFVALLFLDLGWLLVGIGRRVAKRTTNPSVLEDPSRRQFLARITGGAAFTVAGTSVVGGIMEARGEHEIVDVEVKLDKLPKSLDGFTIVQLTDLHVGLTIDRHFVQRVVDISNRLAPDLVAMTGDFVDGKVEDLREEIAPIANLRAKHGIYAVTGNHEYYSGHEPWVAQISKLGVKYLRNERVVIGDGNGSSFELAGVEDMSVGEDMKLATAGRDPNRALVLLAHQPRQVKRAALHGVDLQLSGHTHGGQIWPWHYIVKLQQGGLLAGRYQHKQTQLYVSRGCGYWGPPVRLLAPLEITRVILRAA